MKASRLDLSILGMFAALAFAIVPGCGDDEESSDTSSVGDGDGDGSGDGDGDGDGAGDGDGDGDGTGDGDGDGDGDGSGDCLSVLPEGVTIECVQAMLDAFVLMNPDYTEAEAEAFCADVLEAVDELIKHSSDSITPLEPWIDWTWLKLRWSGSPTLELQEEPNIDFYNVTDDFPCGDGANGHTLCASGNPFPAGPAIVVHSTFHEDIPLDDPTYTTQFGFVFDGDGNADNNYMASVDYPNDFFDNTDRWYVAEHAPGAGWSMAVSDATDGNISAMASDARIVISGNTMTAIIPASEFTVACPGMRQTAFAHTGDWGLNGGDWSADTEPTVDQALAPACE
jgi:hypothetical protein